MRKNIGNIALSYAIVMAIGGFGIGAQLNNIEVNAAATASEAVAESRDGSRSSEGESLPTPEVSIDGESEKPEAAVNLNLPAGFSVSGMSDVRTYSALEDELAALQEKINKKKLVLDIDGELLESSYTELGANIGNKDFILEEAKKYSSGNIIERFVKSSELVDNPENIVPNIAFNEEALNVLFRNADSKNAKAPVNAGIKRVNGAFEISEERDGFAINRDATLEKIKEAALSDNSEAVKAEVQAQEAGIKAEDLKDIKDVLGTFTTNYSSSSSDRATNIAVGTSKMDGVLLMPGETISGYKQMHPFTIANGYKMAKAYQNGLVIDSVGGGACQIATTLYQAALRAEVTITQRQNHSMIVGYVQPSGDAAIAGDYKDIKVTNNRNTPIYVEATTSGRNVTFTIWGKEDRAPGRTLEFVSEVISETPKGKTFKDDPSRPAGYLVKESDGHKGRVSKLWKVIKENGVEVKRELVSSDTYRMSNDIYIRGTRVDAPPPVPETDPNAETVEEPSSAEGGSEAVETAPVINIGPAFDPALNAPALNQ